MFLGSRHIRTQRELPRNRPELGDQVLLMASGQSGTSCLLPS